MNFVPAFHRWVLLDCSEAEKQLRDLSELVGPTRGRGRVLRDAMGAPARFTYIALAPFTDADG
jgi:hypothetical protein